MEKQKIHAKPSIKRLPTYLNFIRQVQKEGYEFISGTVIAQEFDLEPIQVRKDLAITGIVGKPKKGYPIVPLITAIEHFLGWDDIRNAIIIGAGNLATALTGYPGFQRHGLNFVAAFDNDENKIGTNIHGVPVFSMKTLVEQVKNLEATIAVLTVPSKFAQETADKVVDAGIKAIWNFAPTDLNVSESVCVKNVHLNESLMTLSYEYRTMHANDDIDNQD